MVDLDFIFFVLIIILSIYGFVLVYFGFARENQLHIRGKINYENYPKYKKYYQFQGNKRLLNFVALYFFLSILMSFFILHNNVLNMFLYVLAGMIILVSASTLIYIDSKKYNRDLSKFDSYYNAIDLSYLNKVKITDNIKTLVNTQESIKSNIQKLELIANNLFKNHDSITNIDSCLDQVNDEINNQKSLLQSFDNKMTVDFTDALYNYLKSGGVSNTTNYIFDPNKDIENDKIINKSLEKLKDIFRRE